MTFHEVLDRFTVLLALVTLVEPGVLQKKKRTESVMEWLLNGDDVTMKPYTELSGGTFGEK